VDYILSRLEAQFGPEVVQQGGLAVHTTLDPTMQGWAEKAVGDGVHAMANQGVNNGMMMIAKPSTGEVLAWVGSVDYGNAQIGGQFDVIESPRQPGSSFKPYVYEAAYKDHALTPASCVHDTPTDFNGYRPLDFDNNFLGVMPAQQALLLSRNVPTVEVAQKEGIGNVNKLAAQMGIKTPLQDNLTTAIGGSEVTMFDHIQGYQVFADEGKKMPLVTITKISDATGNTLFETHPGQQDGQAQVLTPQESFLITDDLKAYQDQWHLGWKVQMASKSGTTGATIGVHQDAWMMAYNKDIVIGGWAGNTGSGGSGGPISAFGVNTGETMLAEVVNELPADYSHFFTQPSGLVAKNGSLFLAGTENTPLCSQPADSGGPPGQGDKQKPKKNGGGGGGGGG
jgi:membrane peptidoglycan carboxypeptidase